MGFQGLNQRLFLLPPQIALRIGKMKAQFRRQRGGPDAGVVAEDKVGRKGGHCALTTGSACASLVWKREEGHDLND